MAFHITARTGLLPPPLSLSPEDNGGEKLKQTPHHQLGFAQLLPLPVRLLIKINIS